MRNIVDVKKEQWVRRRFVILWLFVSQAIKCREENEESGLNSKQNLNRNGGIKAMSDVG